MARPAANFWLQIFSEELDQLERFFFNILRHEIYSNNIGWIESLKCLKRCGMSIEEMLRYKDLCMEGKSTIPERRKILCEKLKILEAEKEKIQASTSIDYISWKNNFYDDVESGKTQYKSYLLPENGETDF